MPRKKAEPALSEQPKIPGKPGPKKAQADARFGKKFTSEKKQARESSPPKKVRKLRATKSKAEIAEEESQEKNSRAKEILEELKSSLDASEERATPEILKSHGEKQREHALKYRRKIDKAVRDIAPMPDIRVNWERRRACIDNLQLFCETYMRPVFYLDWSADQLTCIRKIEQVVRETATFSLAMPRGGGKALDIDTPIPTPDGWKTMGTLKCGDTVFDKDGNQCHVTYCTEVMENHRCYSVKFDTGEEIIADSDHQWYVYDRYSRTNPLVLTTHTMSDRVDLQDSRGHSSRRYSIPIGGPIQTKELKLPIPPYVLGAWLGDGRSSDARFYSSVRDVLEMVQHFKEAGESLTITNLQKGCYECRIDWRGCRDRYDPTRFQARLRKLKLLNNKHIPLSYRRASYQQRLELLQGLMDTDGSITVDGKCEIATKFKKLGTHILQLLLSLSIKARMTQKVIDGKTYYRISFKAFSEQPVFKLARKLERQIPRKDVALSVTRRIVSITPIKSRPVKCIQVDSPSHTYLCGYGFIPTHNTALCRAGVLWAILSGRRTFPFLVGASHDKALQTLSAIKQYLYQNEGFYQDFPEICYPIRRLENRWNLARGQSYNGELTYIEWGSDSIRLPSILFSKEEIEPFIKNGFEESFEYHEEYDAYLSVTSGSIIRTSGIDGSIRGEAETHPITLRQPRPDMVVLDDIQRDAKVESPETCRRLVSMVDGAIAYLAGPDRKVSALMPCTIIRDGDVSSIYLDRQQKPEWIGERCSFVIHWPEGITNYEIDNESPAGKLWLQYDELRRQSLALYGDLHLASDFYQEVDNRKIMDDGFICSWPEMYDRKSEVSAQQRAMNLRFTNHMSFLAEAQNIGRRLDGSIKHITSKSLRHKQLPYERCHVPPDTTQLVAFIDVQMEILFYSVLAVTPNFTGMFCDYGTWPPTPSRYFTKANTESWSMLTRAFLHAYPQYASTVGEWTGEGTKVRAPLDAKIYHAASMACEYLRNKDYQCGGRVIHINRIGIDTKWGKASDCLKRFCRESGDANIVPYYGSAFLPSHRQLEEYSNQQGWLLHHIMHPLVKESMWVYKPDDMGMFSINADVNRAKTFLIHRLATPPGSPGCISLFKAPPHDHEMFCDHICDSEYPEVIEARGLKKECWKEREGRHDNDFLDCAAGCIIMASFAGAQLHVNPAQQQSTTTTKTKRKYSEMYERKKAFIREQGGGVGVWGEGYL